MLWLAFAIGAALLFGINSIAHRKAVMDESSLSYAFLFNFMGGLVFIPFLVKEFMLPTGVLPWLLVIIASALWSITGVVAFKSVKLVDVSVRAPLSELKIILLLILSVVFLKEVLTFEKVLGTVIIFVGFLVLHHSRKVTLFKWTDKGIKLVLLAAFLIAISSIIDKYALTFFTAGMYGGLVFLLPGLFLGVFAMRKKGRVKSLLKNKLRWLLTAVVLSVVAYYFMLSAYKLADASLVFPIVRSATIITVLGGITFLGERKQIAKKIVATLIVLAGVVLLSGYVKLF